MERIFVSGKQSTIARWAALAVLIAALVWVVAGNGGGTGHAQTSGKSSVQVIPQATPGQDFEDVVPSSGFYSYIHNIYLAGVASGYACVPGGSTDPCVPPSNLPYYHPSANVTRSQMAKFIDLGRRNIADAIGHSLYISTTAGIAVDAETRSGGEAVYAECLQSGNNCYAVEGYAPTGDYAAYFYGGKGVYAESDDAGKPGVDARAYGSNSYAGRMESATYRGGYAKSDSNVIYSMYVDSVDGPTQGTAALNVRGTIRGEGNLVIGGSKAGYVVDVMQNAGSEAFEVGDVVTIVGNSAPVLGQIPVVMVKKASTAYDTGVAGVVDQVVYVPDPATKAAYEQQEADMRAAMEQQNQEIAKARAEGNNAKPDFSHIEMPSTNISDGEGTMHAIPDATQVLPNAYANVVTLGSYKGVKVDASFGAIHAGDMLVASPHAGYAMKATDRSQAFGATIGKALGNLETGTGLLPVLVTLK
jgi:hypothetical protein